MYSKQGSTEHGVHSVHGKAPVTHFSTQTMITLSHQINLNHICMFCLRRQGNI